MFGNLIQKIVFVPKSPTVFNERAVSVSRISEFEGLRAVLCWIVVIGHSFQFSGLTSVSTFSILLAWISWGGHAVNVFIILSGFVIFLLLDSNPGKTYQQFMLERFFRIYPIYIIALTIGIILLPVENIIVRSAWQNPEIAARGIEVIQSSYTYFNYHVLSHVFLMQGVVPHEILPHSSLTLLGLAWSLSLEWQFYIVAPLLLLLLKRPRSLLISIIFLIAFNLVRKLFTDYNFGFGAFLPLKMEFFTVGIISYYGYCFYQRQGRQSVRSFSIISVLTIFILLIGSFFPSSAVSSRAFPMLLWTIVMSSITAKAVQIRFAPFALLNRCLNSSFLQKLGKISYSTYLLHIAVIWLLLWLTSILFPWFNRVGLLTIVITLGFPLVVILSLLLHRFVEKPCISFGKGVSAKLIHRL